MLCDSIPCLCACVTHVNHYSSTNHQLLYWHSKRIVCYHLRITCRCTVGLSEPAARFTEPFIPNSIKWFNTGLSEWHWLPRSKSCQHIGTRKFVESMRQVTDYKITSISLSVHAPKIADLAGGSSQHSPRPLAGFNGSYF